MYMERGSRFWRVLVVLAAGVALVAVILEMFGLLPSYPFQLPVA
jgi:hypothetical protein